MMLNCENCRHAEICKHVVTAVELEKRVEELNEEHKNFCVKVDIRCNHYESIHTPTFR